MKTLLTAGALLVASSQAFAGIVTETASFGVQGSVTDHSIGFGVNQTITVDGFNASLGNLTGVQVTVSGQIDTLGESTNTSGLNGASQFKFNLDSDWSVAGAGDTFVFNGAGNIFTETDSDHQMNEVFNYGHLDIFKTGSFAATDLSAFASDVDFTFLVNATSSFNNQANGGSALFLNKIDSATWGKVEVVYTYDAIVASVPETGSLAIFGLGLAGFALSRKAKKSA